MVSKEFDGCVLVERISVGMIRPVFTYIYIRKSKILKRKIMLMPVIEMRIEIYLPTSLQRDIAQLKSVSIINARNWVSLATCYSRDERSAQFTRYYVNSVEVSTKNMFQSYLFYFFSALKRWRRTNWRTVVIAEKYRHPIEEFSCGWQFDNFFSIYLSIYLSVCLSIFVCLSRSFWYHLHLLGTKLWTFTINICVSLTTVMQNR